MRAAPCRPLQGASALIECTMRVTLKPLGQDPRNMRREGIRFQQLPLEAVGVASSVSGKNFAVYPVGARSKTPLRDLQ